MFAYEKRGDELAPRSVFLKRVFTSILGGLTLIAFALTIGIAGYHWIAGFGWLDSLLEASMILSGMGPVGRLETDAAKVFASLYALFGGIVFIVVMGVVLSPLAHRLIHKFHIETDANE